MSPTAVLTEADPFALTEGLLTGLKEPSNCHARHMHDRPVADRLHDRMEGWTLTAYGSKGGGQFHTERFAELNNGERTLIVTICFWPSDKSASVTTHLTGDHRFHREVFACNLADFDDVVFETLAQTLEAGGAA